MTAFPSGPRNSIVDVPGVRVAHLTRVGASIARRASRAGLTAVMTHPSAGGGHLRPVAVVTIGGHTEVTGLCFAEDFGFTMTPVVATGLRAVGRVHDALLSGRATMGWPPMVVGFDDRYLNDQRGVPFTEEEIASALDSASGDSVAEGAVGAAAGLVAFGYKSGIGSASRYSARDSQSSYVVGTLAILNLGGRDALRVGPGATATRAATAAAPHAMLGSGLIVLVTNAPLDDRQCRRVAMAGLLGLGRIGAVPGVNEGLVACAISTGVLLTRNDRSAPRIDVPLASELEVGGLCEAAAEASEDAGARTLTTVAPEDGTSDYPAMPR